MSNSAFFYGTLMHPKILRRVIQNDAAHLQICPAILLEHTRHKVKYGDYPGVVPYTRSKEHFNHELNTDERSVRGTMVIGLTKSDIRKLDLFEGDEYIRTPVQIYPLGPSLPIESPSSARASITPSTPPSIPTELPAYTSAQTYIWSAPLSQLERELWSYADFITQNAWKWVGQDADPDNYRMDSTCEGSTGITELDRRIAMHGNINREETPTWS